MKFLEPHDFEVGEMITRTGDDAWLVFETDVLTVNVVCIMTQPAECRWAELGETEFNLSRRYELKDQAKA